MKKNITIIGNWKMYFTINQALEWLAAHATQLDNLYKKSAKSLILCPSFESLNIAQIKLANISIGLGAQDCSEHELGAYTGQISAQSLAQIGCNYCIVGHSERRQYQQETSEQIAKKINQLNKNNITPIVCIGETKTEYESKKTEEVIKQQLESITTSASQSAQLFIAYEPIWSIGTGIIPEKYHLQNIFLYIQNLVQSWSNKDAITLLYGGSVNAKNIKQFKNIKHLNGFLIGGASTNVQELKKIVE